MATVVNRTTREVRPSVDASEYPPADWLQVAENDLPIISNVPWHYWKIENDRVVELTAAEKAAADAEQLARAKTSKTIAVTEHAYSQAMVELIEQAPIAKARLDAVVQQINSATTIDEVEAAQFAAVAEGGG